MTRENWEEVRLGDRIQCNPQTKLQKGEEYDFLPMENIKTGCYKFPVGYEKKINNSGGAKFQNGDTVFARITPCLQNGKICKIQGIEKGFGSTEYFVFRAIEGITDPDYVFYLMCHPYIRDLAEKSMVGASGRQRANVVVIENLEISLPPLAEQQRIASILSAYDDLIENNTRRIALLEQMAQTLYRQWFIEYKFPGYQDVEMVDSGTEFGMIPQEWEVKTLGDIAMIVMGQSPKSEFYNTNGDGLLFHQGVTNYGFRYLKDDGYSSEYNKIANNGDIIMSVRAPVGRLNMTDKKIAIGRGLCSICSKYSNQSYLFYFLKSYFYQDDIIGSGSIFASVGKDELHGIKVLYPTVYLIKSFEDNVVTMDEELYNLQKQNHSLKEQRDLLLRKLIG